MGKSPSTGVQEVLFEDTILGTEEERCLVFLELFRIVRLSSAATSCNKSTIQVFINHVPLSDLSAAMMWIAL